MRVPGRHHESPRMTAPGIYRGADGHTFWMMDDGWMGAPTLKDGTPDMAIAVVL